MRKRIVGLALAAVFAISMAATGCGENVKELKDNAKEKASNETTAKETEKETEKAPEETLSQEQMDLLKYNYYVDLNNDLVMLLDDIKYYYMVVDYTEEFSLIPDSGHTYGYRIRGFGKGLAQDCLELSGMEPAYEPLDQLVKEIAEPAGQLMDAFSELHRSHDYADNQYQKAKDLHAIIYPLADQVEPLAYEYMEAVNQMANERVAEEEQKMKDEGRLIAYNASRGITIAGQIADECRLQGVSDENLTDLDLTNIKPLYEELVTVIDDLNAATKDNNQMMKESMSNSRPFDQLYERMLDALEWMMKQVESGKPIEDISLEPLGSLAHFSNTLSDCIDRYNTIFVE